MTMCVSLGSIEIGSLRSVQCSPSGETAPRIACALPGSVSSAITEYGYKGIYKGVYPIKVNQDRYVVEKITGTGRQFHYGLEAGSKPELLAVMAMLDDEEALIVCNGYKDEEYIETALLASKLGRNVILVVEKPSELELIKKIATKTGVKPVFVSAGHKIDLASAKDWVLATPIARAMPKSATTAWPASCKMFAGLMSRCTTPQLCA